jgi:outer membrane protein assembly factor BamB
MRLSGNTLKQVSVFVLSGLFLLAVSACAHAQVDVLTQHNDNSRTGANLRETILTPANVNRARFGLLFKRVVDDQVYTQPLVVTGVAVDGGTRDLVYVTTVNNSVYAFDANDAEASLPVWHVNFGTPANLHSENFGCLDINGQMGIIGTPVIDKTRGVLYVVALTRAGAANGARTGFMQRLHALDLATGADLPESPVTISAPDFNALMQNQRPALMLANGLVYVGYASHCDKDPYHGFLMAYDAKTLAQVSVFNTSPTGSEASIWQSGQGPAADREGNVYVVTGNGSWDGVKNFSESFLKLTPRLKLLDWFTPTNHLELDKEDADLNSSGATLIPGTHLVLGGGKGGVLYTLDARNLGHLGDEQALQRFQATASHLHSLVYWESAHTGNLLYVWGQRDKAKVYKLEGEKLVEIPFMMRDVPNEGHPGAMLSLSANGNKDGVLWAAIHATGDS